MVDSMFQFLNAFSFLQYDCKEFSKALEILALPVPPVISYDSEHGTLNEVCKLVFFVNFVFKMRFLFVVYPSGKAQLNFSRDTFSRCRATARRRRRPS